jgi:hypothetical protein
MRDRERARSRSLGIGEEAEGAENGADAALIGSPDTTVCGAVKGTRRTAPAEGFSCSGAAP